MEEEYMIDLVLKLKIIRAKKSIKVWTKHYMNQPKYHARINGN